ATDGNDVYFFAETLTDGGEIWKSDGTPAGTIPIVGGPQFTGSFDQFATLGGKTLFTSHESLFVTSGVPGDVQQLAGPRVLPFPMNVFLGRVFFEVCNSQGCGLWSSDGTQAGTQQVSALPGAAELRTFMPVGGIAFFLLDNISPIGQFWKTDGTSAGTQLVM